jgi:CheY-like chemotaxis protein
MPRGSETVLLLEDDEAVRALVRQILEILGYTVLEARGGGEALDFTVRHPGPIHLLLADVIMPQMNGYELAQRLRRIRPELRVLFITGYSHSPLVEQILQEGDAAVLPKPFTATPLAQKVRDVLDRPRS